MLGTILILLGLLALGGYIVWVNVDPCPKCGSRLRETSPFKPGGGLADAECGRCRHRWVPDWVKEHRDADTD